MKKKYIGILVFLLLAIGLLWKLNDIFRLKQEDGIVPMELFYEQEAGTIDVMFYGSSHTYSDINPAVLWEQEGIASYDLAGSLQPLWNTYYYMKESLKYQRPKVMVVELVRAIESRDYIEEARTVTNTFGMRFSKDKIENIRISTPDNLIAYLLGYPVYHSRYAELSRADFTAYQGDPHGKVSKGYYPLYVTKSYDSMADMSKVTESSDLAPKSEEYLRKIIALAKEEDIPLVFMISPYQGIIESEQRIFNRCGEIAEEEGIPFLDFNQLYEELNLDPATDMAEASHLNYCGTAKLSSYLATWLSEHYDLPDHRDDEQYASWEENAADWKQKDANQELLEEDSLSNTLEKIMENNGNYTYVLTLTGAYANEELPESDLLRELGMPEEILSEGGIYIGGADGSHVLRSGTDDRCTLEFIASDLEVKVSGANQSVVYSNESELKTLNGINILVYDHFTESLVTAVGFDAENEYGCIH